MLGFVWGWGPVLDGLGNRAGGGGLFQLGVDIVWVHVIASIKCLFFMGFILLLLLALVSRWVAPLCFGSALVLAQVGYGTKWFSGLIGFWFVGTIGLANGSMAYHRSYTN
ncbi:hypothetical protein U1Q18_005734 [Sarracenia purpurea var. burkii]